MFQSNNTGSCTMYLCHSWTLFFKVSFHKSELDESRVESFFRRKSIPTCTLQVGPSSPRPDVIWRLGDQFAFGAFYCLHIFQTGWSQKDNFMHIWKILLCICISVDMKVNLLFICILNYVYLDILFIILIWNQRTNQETKLDLFLENCINL